MANGWNLWVRLVSVVVRRYICSTQSENLRDLQIALRNLRILRTEANLQIVTRSADCVSWYYAICGSVIT